MVTVYLETNVLIAAAMGQDVDIDDLLRANGSSLRLVVPEVCVMESLSVLESKSRERNVFAHDLDRQISQLRRDLTSVSAGELVKHLQLARLENAKVLNDIQDRLRVVLERLHGLHGFQEAEILPSTRSARLQSLSNALVRDPMDNLILHVVAAHAAHTAGPSKLFLSNDAGFNDAGAQALLNSANVQLCRKARELRAYIVQHP